MQNQNQSSAPNEETNIFDLNEDCLQTLFHYLSLGDVLSLLATCTYMWTIPYELLPLRIRKAPTVQINAANCFLINETDRLDYARMVKYICNWPHIELHFEDVPPTIDYNACENIFRLLCDNRTQQTVQLQLNALELTHGMPDSMKEFFQRMQISELHLFNSQLHGDIIIPNVYGLKMEHPDLPLVDISDIQMPSIQTLLIVMHALNETFYSVFLAGHPQMRKFSFQTVA